jgi:hypothetical protein
MSEGQLYKMQLLPKKKIPLWVLVLVGAVFLTLAAVGLGVAPGLG